MVSFLYSDGISQIDVPQFLALCRDTVDAYMASLEESEEPSSASKSSNPAKSPRSSHKNIPSSAIPHSPYDEEVAFNLDEEEEAETVFDLKRTRSPKENEKSKPNTRMGFGSADLDTKSTATRMQEVQDLVKQRVTDIVKKTDLYHILQVHLGFVEEYTLIPPRGSIVMSQPRQWISLRDVQEAFLNCRLRLSDVHVKALVKLVKDFSKAVPAEESTLKKSPVFYAMKISAFWLRKYIVHLRLPNSKTYNAWAGEKEANLKSKVENKPREFERALSGYEHTLSKEEIEEMILKFDIIPSDVMKDEISRRLESWVLDTDGRRELLSLINFELKKWQKENPQTPYVKLVAEDQRKIRMEIKSKLISKKRLAIESSEVDKVINSMDSLEPTTVTT